MDCFYSCFCCGCSYGLCYSSWMIAYCHCGDHGDLARQNVVVYAMENARLNVERWNDEVYAMHET